MLAGTNERLRGGERKYILEPEYPSPGCLLANQTTEDGTEETGHRGNAGDDCRIECVLVRCAHLREDDEGHGVHYTTADALEGTEYDPWSS